MINKGTNGNEKKKTKRALTHTANFCEEFWNELPTADADCGYNEKQNI